MRCGGRLHEQDGTVAVEYAILASMIAAVIVGIVFLLGEGVVALFASVPPF